MAILTHQFGAANLLLGALYGMLLLFPDPAHRDLVYALSVTFVVRAIQAYQTRCRLFFVPALPRWLQDGDGETRKKAPPGKTAQDVQVLLQLVGLGLAWACFLG